MTKNKKILIASTSVLCAVFALYVFQSTSEVRKALETYTHLAKIHTDAAYVPGIPDNPVRQRLNSILSQVLARPMKPQERLALAHDGLVALKEAEGQIDAIGDAGEKVQNAISYLDEKSRAPGAFLQRKSVIEILALAKQEFNVVADIRGLSYRANFTTTEIFNRIVLDNGALTPAYTAELNKDIPDVEDQFNKRTALYDQLKSLTARLEKTISTM